MTYVYEDLYDIEKRPGAGVALWTKTVEMQLERVREVNYRHRLNHSPNESEQRDDPNATDQLHADVYFLALAIRRVLLFHDALQKQINDSRLDDARNKFNAEAPNAKLLRDFYEHLDQYLLDDPSKHRKEITGRAAPVLMSRWATDDVVVAFGPLRADVTLAAVAAIELGKTSTAIHDVHFQRSKEEPSEPPPADDGVERIFEVKVGVSAVIGGEDEGHEQIVGTLLGVNVREATPEEIARVNDESDEPARA